MRWEKMSNDMFHRKNSKIYWYISKIKPRYTFVTIAAVITVLIMIIYKIKIVKSYYTFEKLDELNKNLPKGTPTYLYLLPLGTIVAAILIVYATIFFTALIQVSITDKIVRSYFSKQIVYPVENYEKYKNKSPEQQELERLYYADHEEYERRLSEIKATRDAQLKAEQAKKVVVPQVDYEYDIDEIPHEVFEKEE